MVPLAEERMLAVPLGSNELEGFQLDGLLAEDFWADAERVTGFRQAEPLEGEEPTERTDVRMAYDDEALYVGVTAYDSDPDRIVGRILQRDKIMEVDAFGGGLAFAGDDAVAILLDPFHDHRNGVVFATNMNGAEFEALIANEGGEINVDWRGVWEVAATRTAFGWSAEFQIPWRTLRYPAGERAEPWGFNVYRIIRRKNEQVLWRSWGREGEGFHRVGRAGHIDGLVDLPRPGLNAEVKPFFLTGVTQSATDLGELPAEGEMDVGLDLKAEVLPGLVLDLTVNTDFAQVEADAEQVNLTRFSLFFPEKRDFFLENSGVFELGTGAGSPFEPPPFLMFFSRRVGISEDGPVPMRGGARLTGRAGGQTLGFMHVRSGEAFDMPGESFSLARVKRDVGESAYIGAMLTDRRGGEAWNTVGGIDGQFRPADGWNVRTFFTRTFTEGEGGDDHAYQLAADYEGDRWSLFFNHLEIGPEAKAEAGLVTRTDLRRTEIFPIRRWRPTAFGLRSFEVRARARYQSTLEGSLQDWNVNPSIGFEWNSGEEFNAFFGLAETVVDSAFSLTDDVDVVPGRYDANVLGWFLNTSRNRPLYLDMNGMASEFHGGTLFSVGGWLNLAPSPSVALALGYQRNDVDVPGGSFVANVSSLRVAYSFSTKMTTNVLMQHNSLANTFSTNVRFNLVHRPGSDLFIVLTEQRGRDEELWDVEDRALVLKLTYLARL